MCALMGSGARATLVNSHQKSDILASPLGVLSKGLRRHADGGRWGDCSSQRLLGSQVEHLHLHVTYSCYAGQSLQKG